MNEDFEKWWKENEAAFWEGERYKKLAERAYLQGRSDGFNEGFICGSSEAQ